MFNGLKFYSKRSQCYSDGEEVVWDLTSKDVEQEIQNAGGIIVGISMVLDYPNEDESANFGFCTGLEDNVPDMIYGTVTKNSWTFTESIDSRKPGSHILNLTWHNQSLLEMENISGMSKSEILNQIDLGEVVFGTYSFKIMVKRPLMMEEAARTQIMVRMLQAQYHYWSSTLI